MTEDEEREQLLQQALSQVPPNVKDFLAVYIEWLREKSYADGYANGHESGYYEASVTL
jgi:hypothetical protein